MATTAKDAAQESARATAAAEKAAEAARDAAIVAQSQIEVDFAGRLMAVAQSDGSGHTPCIQIKSYGDSVVIQRVRSKRSFRELDDSGALGTAELMNETFLPSEEGLLPRRLHRDEIISLTHPALGDGGAPFGRFIVEVDYTFAESGGPGGTKVLAFNAANSKW